MNVFVTAGGFRVATFYDGALWLSLYLGPDGSGGAAACVAVGTGLYPRLTKAPLVRAVAMRLQNACAARLGCGLMGEG